MVCIGDNVQFRTALSQTVLEPPTFFYAVAIGAVEPTGQAAQNVALATGGEALREAKASCNLVDVDVGACRQENQPIPRGAMLCCARTSSAPRRMPRARVRSTKLLTRGRSSLSPAPPRMAVKKRIFSQALSFSRNLKRRMSSGSNAERRKRDGRRRKQ
jgi:hypothetical protein